MTNKLKMSPIPARMVSADFYPEDGDGTFIHITVKAPFDSRVLPGDVYIISADEYTSLMKEKEID